MKIGNIDISWDYCHFTNTDLKELIKNDRIMKLKSSI